MKNDIQRNFHLPLPERLYIRLKSEAERARKPATTVARQALEDWLTRKERDALSDAITAYATEMAGTEADLDPVLETAAIDCLLSETEAYS